jgi:hypothetical protein
MPKNPSLLQITLATLIPCDYLTSPSPFVQKKHVQKLYKKPHFSRFEALFWSLR